MRRGRLAVKQPSSCEKSKLFGLKDEHKHEQNLKGKWKEYLGPMNIGRVTKVREEDEEKFDSIKKVIHAEINKKLLQKGFFLDTEQDPDCDPSQYIDEAIANFLLLVGLGEFEKLITDIVSAIETFINQFDILTILENLFQCVENTLEELLGGLIIRIIFSYLIIIFVVAVIALIALYFSESISASTLAISVVGLIIILILFGALTGLLIVVFVQYEKDVLINCFITARDALVKSYSCALTAALIDFINGNT